MVEMRGLEPLTSTMSMLRSNQLSYTSTSRLDFTLRIPLCGLLRVPSAAPFPLAVRSLRSLDQLGGPASPCASRFAGCFGFRPPLL
jgi:hypothetical protein